MSLLVLAAQVIAECVLRVRSACVRHAQVLPYASPTSPVLARPFLVPFSPLVRRPNCSTLFPLPFLPYELYELPPQRLRVRKAQVNRQHPDHRRGPARWYPSSRPSSSSNTSTPSSSARTDAAHRRRVLDHQSPNEPPRSWQSPAELHGQLSSRRPRRSYVASPGQQPHPAKPDGWRPSSHQHRCARWISTSQHGCHGPRPSSHGRPSSGRPWRSSPGLWCTTGISSWPSSGSGRSHCATVPAAQSQSRCRG